MVRPVSVLSLAAVLAMSVTISGQQTTQKPPPARPPATRPPAPTTKPAAPATAKPATAPAPTPPKPPTDVRMKTSYTHGAQVSQNVTYLQGPRQRVEFPGVVSLEQCDLKRSVMLNTNVKKYRTIPYPETTSPAATPAADATMSPAVPQTPAKGGVVTLTTTLTDTLERQQMFGREARRVKTVMIKQATSNACDKTPMKVEVDAWYVDLPEQSACMRPAAAAPPPPADPNACTDRFETRTAGDVKLGFAVKSTTSTTIGEGNKAETTTSSQEVTELEITRLDRALFEIPKDYTEANSSAEIVPEVGDGGLAHAVLGSTADGTSSAAPRKPGTIRIGVLEAVNKTQRELSATLREDLVSKFNKAPYEALPVAGTSPADAQADAARLECDYLLLVEITEARTSKPSKIGGMMQKVSGEGAKDNHDVKLDYKLFAVGAAEKPRATGNAKASNGGFGMGSALRLAAFAGQMYLSMGMMGGMGMNGMMGMGMNGAAMGGGMLDPRMAAMSSMASSVGAGMGGMQGAAGGDPSEQQMRETVSEALGNAAKATMEQLSKKK